VNVTIPLADLSQKFDMPVIKEHSASSRPLASVSVPPSDEEQSLFLSEIAKCKSVVCLLILAYFSSHQSSSFIV